MQHRLTSRCRVFRQLILHALMVVMATDLQSLTGRADEGSKAQPSATEQGGDQKLGPSTTVSARPHQVGYRRETFEFKNKSGQLQSRQLDIWYPTLDKEQRYVYRGQVGFAVKDAAVAPGRHPLLLFSHGFLGASDQSIFLTEACARAGYVVVSMNHTDAFFNRRDRRLDPPEFSEFEKWTDNKYRDRHEDLTVLLDRMLKWNEEAASAWEGRIDAERIGGVGHSLGGYTILGMAGSWKSWADPRLKAAVLLSPYAHPYGPKGDLPQVKIPLMLQSGTFDIGINPSLPPIYAKLGGPKVLLVLKFENHFGWTNLASVNRTTKDCVASGNPNWIVQYTIAFFDHFLLHESQSEFLERANPRLDSYQFSGFESATKNEASDKKKAD